MLDKAALIQERARSLERISRSELRRAWEQYKGDRLHFVSVQPILSEHFDWNLDELAKWASELGFDGLELRAETISRWQNQKPPQDVEIGIHLSDKAYWTSLWSIDPKRIRWAFGSFAVASDYLGYTDSKQMVESLRREIVTGRELRSRYFVFHASEIDYDAVISGQLQDDKPVLAAAAQLLQELSCPEILIENAPPHEAGAHGSQEIIHLSQLFGHARFALDTSHLQVYLYSLQNGAEISEEIRGLRLDSRIAISVVHLSESALRTSSSGRGPRLEDFWERRKLTIELVVDDHLPVGQSLKNPWEILEAAGAPIVTHELKAETFELLEQALLVQQAYLAGFEI